MTEGTHSTTAEDAKPGVRIKPLAWDEIVRTGYTLWTAKSILGTYSVGFDDGWWACLEDGTLWEWNPDVDCRTLSGPSASQRACQAHFEAEIRSALVDA